jgi:hypothetical protein
VSGKDRSGAWLLGVLAAAVVASELYVVKQNGQLRQQINAESAVDRQVKYLRTKTDRTLYEATMQGRCQPFFNVAGPRAARPLSVAIYFSLEHDCLSCVQGLVSQWNEELKGAQGKAFTVTGYTEVDGAQDEKILTRDLRPSFPVVRVEHIEQKLAATGLTFTPVVLVTDPATGRILLTYAPLATEKGDHSLPERLEALLTPCR